MEQEELWLPDWRECVRAVAVKVGGDKRLAGMLWPAKSAEQGAAWLRDCLSQERAAKLDVEEYLKVAEIGREHGVHLVVYQFCDATGYTRPAPISPEDERAELERKYIGAVQQLAKLAERMERTTARGTR